jgi:simple sugar transport system permease protein
VIESILSGLLVGSIHSGTPLLYATLSEAISERAGIVNLGLEGVMLMGAVVGFATTALTGNAALGVLAAALAGGLFNLFFGFLVITRRANQLASGLAMMFCGVGLSALLGVSFVGSKIKGLD